MKKKYGGYNFAIKQTMEDGGFAGYASVFGVVDYQGDVVMPGAFKDSLIRRRGKIKLLWQHQTHEPIGVINHIYEDNYGLYVRCQLLLDLYRSQEAYSMLLAQVINGLSIGYSVLESEYNKDEQVRMITKVDLWEISLVTFPANEMAVVKKF